jgi:hypothetical protein
MAHVRRPPSRASRRKAHARSHARGKAHTTSAQLQDGCAARAALAEAARSTSRAPTQHALPALPPCCLPRCVRQQDVRRQCDLRAVCRGRGSVRLRPRLPGQPRRSLRACGASAWSWCRCVRAARTRTRWGQRPSVTCPATLLRRHLAEPARCWAMPPSAPLGSCPGAWPPRDMRVRLTLRACPCPCVKTHAPTGPAGSTPHAPGLTTAGPRACATWATRATRTPAARQWSRPSQQAVSGWPHNRARPGDGRPTHGRRAAAAAAAVACASAWGSGAARTKPPLLAAPGTRGLACWAHSSCISPRPSVSPGPRPPRAPARIAHSAPAPAPSAHAPVPCAPRPVRKHDLRREHHVRGAARRHGRLPLRLRLPGQPRGRLLAPDRPTRVEP